MAELVAELVAALLACVVTAMLGGVAVLIVGLGIVSFYLIQVKRS